MADALSLVESLCHGCLSADRELSPIGEFSDMFTMICQRKVRVPGMTDIYVCWECTATLKRIQTFNKQVNKAQNKLRLFIRKKDLQNSPPKSLSKLNTSKTNHNFISVTESETKIKKEDDSDVSDVNNEEDELKQDPTFTVDLKDLEEKKHRIRRYDRISTADEMCMKEQARQSDLVHLWERDKRVPLGSDASGTMCMESEELSNSNHNEHKPRICNLCQAHYRTLEELSSHVTSHDVYRCLVCGHRSPSLEAAGLHVTLHGEIIKCRLCEYCCRTYRQFREHYKIAHVEFVCDHCGKKCGSKKKLELHISVHHTARCFHCHHCPRTFSFKRRLDSHIAWHHDVWETEDTLCVECNVQLKNRTRFKAHLNYKHADQLGKPSKKERVKCLEPGCEKTYAQRSVMMDHYQYVHQGRSRYHCGICDKYFLGPTRYNEHRRYTHEGAQRKRDKMCGVCGRGFSLNRTLRHHMRTHTGERPYACAVCDARFAQKGARDVHQKKHS